MQILNSEFVRDDTNVNAMGGTELLCTELISRIDKTLLDEFQIIVSRLNHPLQEDKIRIYYCHDLSTDSACDHLDNEGWKNFHRLIFVSNWQMQSFIRRFNIPWSKCMVIQNAINPVENIDKDFDDKIRLGYWSTPHRGLNILVPVFKQLSEEHDNIELDVFSSFELYGWKERNKHYQDLIDQCKEHKNINYHGTVDNDTLRDHIRKVDILSYPSIWEETSCLTLIEAMSAGCLCVHSNLGALSETSANWTMQYQYVEDLNVHAGNFYHVLKAAISNLKEESIQSRLSSQVSYTNVFYNWDIRARQWTAYLGSLLDEDRALPKPVFEYRT